MGNCVLERCVSVYCVLCMVCLCVCVCVCICVGHRRERFTMCVSVCGLCVSTREPVRMSVCVCVCVWEGGYLYIIFPMWLITPNKIYLFLSAVMFLNGLLLSMFYVVIIPVSI